METEVEVKVLNKNSTLIADMYDGILYRFEPNTPVKIPLAAAKNIFGVDFPEDAETCQSDEFRAKIFENLSRRWGWNTYDENKYKHAKKTFNNLILTPVVMQLVEKEPVEVNLAAPREENAKAKGAKPGKYLQPEPMADDAPEQEEVA